MGMEMRAKAPEDVLTVLSAHAPRGTARFVRVRTKLRAMSEGLGVVDEAKPTTGGEGSPAVHVG
jgi:hypothetical protein